MNAPAATHTVTPSHSTAPVARSGRFARAGLVAGVVAAVANLAVVAVADGLDVDLAIDGKRIPLLGFPQVTLIAVIIGIGLAAAFARRARPRRAFTATTVVLTAVSLVPPVLVDATSGTKVVLELTHLLAAFIVIPAIASRLAD